MIRGFNLDYPDLFCHQGLGKTCVNRFDTTQAVWATESNMASSISLGKYLRQIHVNLVIILMLTALVKCKEDDEKPEEKWKKKDLTDYTDADIERLYDQWEVRLNF